MNIYYRIIAEIFGVLGIASSIISFQCNKHGKIMLFRTLNEFLFAIQYIMLGAYTGAAMNIVGCVRNEIFAYQVKKGKSTNLVRFIFSALFLISGLLTWGGAKSILIIFAKITSTYAYGSEKTKNIRLLILTTCTCWLIYNAFVGSVTGVLCETFTLASIILGIIRFDIMKKKEA